MFINTYYLHWEDWPTASNHTPIFNSTPYTRPMKTTAKQGTHTLLSSMMTPFVKELGPLLR